jgi:hypothetical protein
MEIDEYEYCKKTLPPYHVPQLGPQWKESQKCGFCRKHCKQMTFMPRAGKWRCPAFER